MDEQVIIVGAGPTGLMLAGWLARLGVRALVVDGKAGPTRETRALAVQARSLETYDMLGIGGRAIAEGLPARGINLWTGGHLAGRAEFANMGEGVSPHPYIFILGQDRNEALLLDHLEAHGGEVAWGSRLTGLTQDEAEVSVTLTDVDGATRDLRAAWVCGCDGASSAVRHALQMGFPGGTYAHRFFVADVAADGDLVEDELNLCLDEARFAAFFPMPGYRRFRIVGMVPDALGDREDLGFEDVRADVEGHFPAKVTSVSWFATYHVHHRVADHFRAGRVFLVGDAAHIHSPVGGQGMNTGLMDATNLAWKLAMVVNGRADRRLLESYAREREPFAHTLVQTTDRVFSVVTSDTPLAAFIRMHVVPTLFPALTGFAATRHAVFGLVSQTRMGYRGSPIARGTPAGVQGGDRLPWVRFPDGTSNFDALTALAPRLHVYGDPAPEVAAWVARHPALGLCRFPFTSAVAAAGLRLNAPYLVRPDGYVGYAALRFAAPELDAYLAEAWGWAARAGERAG